MKGRGQKQELLRSRTGPLLITAGAAAALLLVLTESFRFGCFLRNMFGLPCPACGMSRAAAALWSGDWQGALQLHPLILLAAFDLLLCLFALAAVIIRKIKRRQMTLPAAPPGFLTSGRIKIFAAVNYALLFLVWLIRMLFLFPGTEPMTVNRNALVPLFFRVLFYP